MRGFLQSEINIARTRKVAEKIREFNSKPNHNRANIISAGLRQNKFVVTVVYEYIPLQKRDSVPVENTAFPRQLANNGFIVATWEENTQENWEWAKKLVEELLELLEGDGNKPDVNELESAIVIGECTRPQRRFEPKLRTSAFLMMS
jgi:hypothetical protein